MARRVVRIGHSTDFRELCVPRHLVVMPVVLMLVGLAACSPGGGPTAPDSPDPAVSSATPSAGHSTPSPTPEKSPTGRKLWSAHLPHDRTGEYAVTRSSGTYLVRGKHHVLALSGSGRERWHFHSPKATADDLSEKPELHLTVTGDVAVISYQHPSDDRWPHRTVVKAFDVRTGNLLWKDSRSSFVTTFKKTVYTSRCNGKQDGRRGNCVLSARRVHSGQARWRTPVRASAQVDDGKPPATDLRAPKESAFVLLKVYPHGEQDRTIRTLDPRAARFFGASTTSGNRIESVGNTMVNAGHHDRKSANGCGQKMAGLDLRTGDTRWKHRWDTPQTGKSCSGLLGDVRTGNLWSARPATKRPVLLNLATGKSHWTSPRKGRIVWASHKHVLTADAKQGPYRLINHRTGRRLWKKASAKMHNPAHTWDSSTADGVAVHSHAVFGFDGHQHKACRVSGCATRVFDLKSGKQRYRVPGTLAGGGDGWVATVQEKAHSRRAVIRAYTKP